MYALSLMVTNQPWGSHWNFPSTEPWSSCGVSELFRARFHSLHRRCFFFKGSNPKHVARVIQEILGQFLNIVMTCCQQWFQKIHFHSKITTRLCLSSTAKSYCRARCFWIYCRQVSKDSAWSNKREVIVCVCMYLCTCVFASTYRCSRHSSHLFWMHIWVGCHPFALTPPPRNSHRSIPTCLLQCVSRICMALVCLQ